MMPAIPEDIVVLFAFCAPLIFTQAIPFAMRMLLNASAYLRYGDRSIASRLKEEAIIDIHQAVEAELFIDPTHLWQQLTPKSQEIALNSIHIWPLRFLKFAQIFCSQSIRSGNPYGCIGQGCL